MMHTKLDRKVLLSSIAATALMISGAAAQTNGQQTSQDQSASQSQTQTQTKNQQQTTAQGQQSQQSGSTQGQQATQQGSAQGAAQGQQQDDALVATVGDKEIRQSDVVAVIAGLPPQVRQSPPQMLVPAVLEQLVLQELILDRARAENLQEDPEVVALVENDTAAVEDQALVKVWLERALADRVTDADIQAAYDEAKAANPDMTQTLEQVRPQIEQMLQRQAMAELGNELRQDKEIVFYGPGGQPVPADGQQNQQ